MTGGRCPAHTLQIEGQGDFTSRAAIDSLVAIVRLRTRGEFQENRSYSPYLDRHFVLYPFLTV